MVELSRASDYQKRPDPAGQLDTLLGGPGISHSPVRTVTVSFCSGLASIRAFFSFAGWDRERVQNGAVFGRNHPTQAGFGRLVS
jgi:hypothetical protein